MKNRNRILVIALALALVAIVLLLILPRSKSTFPKRQTENQILVYHDSDMVELYFHNPEDSGPVDIRVEFCVGDGPLEIARSDVQPGETVTLLHTRSGEPVLYFREGVYTGRILVYDLESGRLKERIEPLEFRIYPSYEDDYDSLQPSNAEREVILDETEYRPEHLMMRVDLKTEELNSGFYGLCAEWRELDVYVYARIGGREILIAKEDRLPPRSITFQLYLEPGVADLLSEGETIPEVRVDSYYSDTGEFYDSIPAEISEIFRSS